MKWFTIPIVVLVTFTLYGIDGIAMQLEDPFGVDKNDIRMDAIVEDVREEIWVLLEEWKRVGDEGRTGEMFIGGKRGGEGDMDMDRGRWRGESEEEFLMRRGVLER